MTTWCGSRSHRISRCKGSTSPSRMGGRAAVSSSSASCSKRWVGRSRARRTSRPSVLAANAILNAGTEEQKAKLLPADRRQARRPPRSRSQKSPGQLGCRCDRGRGQAGWRFVQAERGQELCDRRAHRRRHRRLPLVARAERLGSTSSTGMRMDWTRQPLKTVDMTRKQARLEFVRHSGTLTGRQRGCRGRPREDPRSDLGLPGGRDGRGLAKVSRHGGRLRQDAHPIRPADRCIPGRQAPVCRHAAGSGVRQDRRLLRDVGRGRRR